MLVGRMAERALHLGGAMLTPAELGRYRVLAPIGRGGMSTVFAGEHVVLRRPVAIKVLHPHLAAESAMARRMLDEARTVATLQHPGIVEVLDVGMTDDGRTFVVMERLHGEALAERLRRGRLTEERAVAFARQLASALAIAHAAGVIHRDLKPDNVFLIPDPDVAGGERVKILDFGIAKRITPDDPTERTKTGIVLGTPAYMAPEQCTGRQDVDTRADIYALGVVMFLMVTGELPFGGTSTDEIFAEHVFCAPRPATELAPVSPRFVAVMERCLAKRPEDRFQSMGQLLVELDGFAGIVAEAADDEITSQRPLASERVEPPAEAVAETERTPPLRISSPKPFAPVPPPVARAVSAPVIRLTSWRTRWVVRGLLGASAVVAGVTAALVVQSLSLKQRRGEVAPAAAEAAPVEHGAVETPDREPARDRGRDLAERERVARDGADREHAERQRSERADRDKERSKDRAEKAERAEKERADKAEKVDRAEKADKAERADKDRSHGDRDRDRARASRSGSSRRDADRDAEPPRPAAPRRDEPDAPARPASSQASSFAAVDALY